MIRLERLTAEHADAVLAFERANRAYFTRTIGDRGDAYFDAFADRHRALLAEQEAGDCHFHVAFAADGERPGALVGRVNLIDVTDGEAELGYRVAAAAAGRGVATAMAREVCRLAAGPYGLRGLTAVTTLDNPASRTVLEHVGFTPAGATDINGSPALRYRLPLPPPRSA